MIAGARGFAPADPDPGGADPAGVRFRPGSGPKIFSRGQAPAGVGVKNFGRGQAPIGVGVKNFSRG